MLRSELKLIRDLLKVPTLAGKTLEHESEVETAAKYKDMHSIVFLTGHNMPIAYEGALKLKEISHIHAKVIQQEK